MHLPVKSDQLYNMKTERLFHQDFIILQSASFFSLNILVLSNGFNTISLAGDRKTFPKSVLTDYSSIPSSFLLSYLLVKCLIIQCYIYFLYHSYTALYCTGLGGQNISTLPNSKYSKNLDLSQD